MVRVIFLMLRMDLRRLSSDLALAMFQMRNPEYGVGI